MLRLRALIGYLFCALVIFVPTWVVMAVLLGFGLTGVVAAAILSLVALFLVALRGGGWLRRFHRAEAAPSGLAVSLDRALFERGIDRQKLPQLWSFPDPAPGVLVMRSLVGKGHVLLSQGLLDRLTEAELRAVLRLAIQEVRDPLLPLRSLGGALAAAVLRRAPSSWKDALVTTRAGENLERAPMKVGQFLCFAFLLGIAECFAKAAPAFSASSEAESSDPDLAAARHKVARGSAHWGLHWMPGAARLYLFPPLTGPQTDLMSLSSA